MNVFAALPTYTYSVIPRCRLSVSPSWVRQPLFTVCISGNLPRQAGVSHCLGRLEVAVVPKWISAGNLDWVDDKHDVRLVVDCG